MDISITPAESPVLKRKDLEAENEELPSKKPKIEEPEEEEKVEDWDDEFDDEYLDVEDKDLILWHKVRWTDDEKVAKEFDNLGGYAAAIPRDAWGSGNLKHFASLEAFDSFVRDHVKTPKQLAEVISALMNDKRSFDLIFEEKRIPETPRIQTAARVLRLPIFPTTDQDWDVNEVDFSSQPQGVTPSRFLRVDHDLVLWSKMFFTKTEGNVSCKTEHVSFAVPKDAWGQGKLCHFRTPQQLKIYLSRYVHKTKDLENVCKSFQEWEMPWDGQLFEVTGPAQHVVMLPVLVKLL